MTKEEIEKQASDLRSLLRGSRSQANDDTTKQSGSDNATTGNTGGDSQFDTHNESAKTGHGLQPVSGSGSTTSISIGQSHNDTERSGSSPRGLAPLDIGKRQTTGRSGANNSQGGSNGSNLSTSAETTSRSGGRKRVGNITTDEEIPTRQFNQQTITETSKSSERLSTTGSGKTTKSSVKSDPKSKIIEFTSVENRKNVVENVIGAASTLIKEGTTIGVGEAKALEIPLKEAIKDFAKYTDQALWKRVGNGFDRPVWSDMDEEELSMLVKVLLKSGQRSPAMAKVVRNVLSSHDYVALYMILGPRTITTAQIIQQTRKTKTKKETVPDEDNPRRKRILGQR